MRPVHGSMMDAIGTTADAWQRLPQKLLDAAWPDPANPQQAPLAWAPLARAAAAQSLCGQVAGRQGAQSLQAGLAWPALAFDPEAWHEGLELTQAALRQWGQLQANWIEGLTEIASEMGQLRRANTVSKYVDQEVNLAQQFMALATSQLTASARLAENVQNNLAFWLSQRALAAAPADTAAPSALPHRPPAAVE